MQPTMKVAVVATLMSVTTVLSTGVVIGSERTNPVATPQAADSQNAGDRAQPCGPRTVRGRYGFTVTGTQFFPPPAPPLQAATVGTIEFDGRGGFTGSDIASFSGQVFSRTLTGTYSVHGSCTLDATLEVLTGTPGLRFSFSAVIVDQGREILFIQTDPGSLFVGSLKK
jgi:hypothetical protein